MELKKEIPTSELIKDARAALEKGDQNSARAYALLAVERNVDVEQAWLILASISQPKQALRYIENALLANPNSLPAKKAIRLIYKQITEQKNNNPIKPLVSSLQDTSPIPTIREQQDETPATNPVRQDAGTESKTEFTTPKKLPAAAESEPDQPESEKDKSGTISKKTVFRNKLSSKSSINAVESSVEPPITKANLTNRKMGKSGNKVKTEHEIPEIDEKAVSIPQESIEKEISIGDRLPEPPEVPPAPATDLEVPPENQQPEEIIKPADIPADIPPIPQSDHQVLPAKPNLEILDGSQSCKKAVHKSVTKPRPEKKSSKKTQKKESKPINSSTNVDTIELVLISVAAILLPLMVFLYFYLTK
jgi:hypothetical protein